MNCKAKKRQLLDIFKSIKELDIHDNYEWKFYLKHFDLDSKILEKLNNEDISLEHNIYIDRVLYGAS